MNAPELLYGERAGDRLPMAARPLDPNLTDSTSLQDVEIFYALLETPMTAARAVLPKSLHPSVPALLGVTCWRVGDGPLGAFTLAWVGVACRTGIKPRHFVTAAFCDHPEAGAWFMRRYGLPCTNAALTCRETYDRVALEVAIDGRPILSLTMAEALPLIGAGATVKYSPPLAATRVGEDAVLVQFEGGYDFKRVLRGPPRVRVWEPDALGTAPALPTTPVSATHARCDVHLDPVRFVVDPVTPAEQGGASRIAR